jgi:hypothetical protein
VIELLTLLRMDAVKLSPEAVGVLRALSGLGVVRRFDAAGLELAKAGLARVRDGSLVMTERGRAFARAAAHATGRGTPRADQLRQ